jgi:hypothetical protein
VVVVVASSHHLVANGEEEETLYSTVDETFERTPVEPRVVVELGRLVVVVAVTALQKTYGVADEVGRVTGPATKCP